MIPTTAMLVAISKSRPPASNIASVVTALERYGRQLGLDRRTRLIHFIAQIAHESGGWMYDREIWGPTPAQQRYDTRPDLGNTPALDGDGHLYMGRTGIQITGKANVEAFRDWCRKHIDPNCPDFVAHPDLMNTDPWEGLGPVWYWSTHDLNKYADQNNAEMVTRVINGKLNGYDDRLDYFGRTGLVFLGARPTAIKEFQLKHGLTADGIVGPKTRAALWNQMLVLDRADAASGPVSLPPAADPPKAPTDAQAPPAPATAVPEGFWAAIAAIWRKFFG
jgi:putative chitinase